MTENDIDEEPILPIAGSSKSTKQSTAYQELKRDLSEDELTSPGALKLMLNDLDRLNDEVAKTSPYKDLFHEKDKEVAVLEGKLIKNTNNEILYSVAITIGSALLGVCPAIWEKSIIYGPLSLAFGAVLILFGFISKFR